MLIIFKDGTSTVTTMSQNKKKKTLGDFNKDGRSQLRKSQISAYKSKCIKAA